MFTSRRPAAPNTISLMRHGSSPGRQACPPTERPQMFDGRTTNTDDARFPFSCSSATARP